MEEIELTPEQIDGINKLARFIKDYTEEEQFASPSPATRRRPRCPSCDDGKHYNGKQLDEIAGLGLASSQKLGSAS